MEKLTLAGVLLLFSVSYCLFADDENVVMQKTPLDSSNALIVRCHIKQLATPTSSNAHEALPQGLPQGAHWGPPVSSQEQTYEVVLLNGKQESILESFQFTVPNVAIGTWMPERFTFFDSQVSSNTAHYVYIAQNTVHIVRLDKLNQTFQRAKDTSFSYDTKMGTPKFQRAEESALTLKFSQSKKLFKENSSGDFVEQK